MEINFTYLEIQQLKNAGSNIGSFLNSCAFRYLRKKVFEYTKFLPNNSFVIQRVWHVIHGVDCTIKCKKCHTGLPKWSHDDKFYRPFCSVKCSRTQAVITAKMTCMEKYGVDNPMKVSEIKESASSTMVEKYGVKWYCSTADCKKSGIDYITAHKDAIVDKREQTCLSKYGSIHPTTVDSIKSKSIKTNMKKYGVPYSSQNSTTRDKSRKTSIQRFGVPYAVQNAEIHNKNMISGHKYKNYTLPSGKIIQVQGWENKALDILLLTYDEHDLITERSHMPIIWYYNNDSRHRYYPDIYIPKENKIIEVKSKWTYNKSISINLLKKAATEEAGYSFEFMIL